MTKAKLIDHMSESSVSNYRVWKKTLYEIYVFSIEVVIMILECTNCLAIYTNKSNVFFTPLMECKHI